MTGAAGLSTNSSDVTVRSGPSSSRVAFAASSFFTYVNATFAPRFANASAIARPRPRDPPVTSTLSPGMTAPPFDRS
jgi:hypothetical protein